MQYLQNWRVVAGVSFLAAFGTVSFEHYMLTRWFPSLYLKSTNWQDYPKAYGFVIFSFVLTVFTLSYLANKVRVARLFYQDKVKKDGADGEVANFSYPRLYAEGNSDDALRFNCIQRGHQQALETYTQFTWFMLMGGCLCPLSATLAGVVWCMSRIAYAKAYVEDPTTPTKCGISVPCSGLCYSAMIGLITTLMVAVHVLGACDQVIGWKNLLLAKVMGK
jgi:glutathione S-transferase